LPEIISASVTPKEKERVAVLANLEDLADVGVIDRRNRHRLATEALPRLRVSGRRLRQQLDRDLALEARVQSAIDHAHSSRTERRQDLVRSESSTRRKSWHDAVYRARAGAPAIFRASQALLGAVEIASATVPLFVPLSLCRSHFSAGDS
jgi:hypothetical protein